MSIQRQLIRGNTATIEGLVPLPAQFGFDTDKHEAHVGDGVTAGAVRLAKKNIADSLEPAQITSSQNDYDPANQKHARTLLLTTDAFHDITGLVPTTVTNDIDGRELTIYNYGTNNFRLVDQSPASSAANRFDLGGASLTLSPKTSATLRYDKALQRWILIAQTVGSAVGAGSVIAMTLAASSQGYSIINGTIQTSVSGGALTINIKTLAGNDPSSLDPVLVKIRKGTLSDGGFTVFTLTAATSFVVSNGSSLGVSGASVPFRLWLVAFDDGGTFRLGVVNCLLGYAFELGLLKSDALASSTAEGGAGAADSSGVFYTGAAVASKPFEVLGYLDYPAGLAAAGTWSINPTTIQPFHAGIRLPGGISDLATGTADGSQYVRDDRKLAYPHKAMNPATYSFTDWNTVQIPGEWSGFGLSNAPGGGLGWFYVQVVQHVNYNAVSSIYLKQIATDLQSGATWVRVCSNGTWTAWRRLDSRVLLNTLTASGSASLNDTSSISSNFQDYELVLEALTPATGSAGLMLQVQVAGSFQTASYLASAAGFFGSLVVSSYSDSVRLCYNSAGTSLSGRVTIFNPASTSAPIQINGQTSCLVSGANQQNLIGGAYNANGAVTGFRIQATSGNITSGSVKVYGLG